MVDLNEDPMDPGAAGSINIQWIHSDRSIGATGYPLRPLDQMDPVDIQWIHSDESIGYPVDSFRRIQRIHWISSGSI